MNADHPKMGVNFACRSTPEPVRFSWRASEAWRSAVCPTIQRLTGMPAVEDMFNRNASATPAFLL
ncbi:MAG: hypothetical protein Tsb0016_06810 [Sphingomonadales bacterium]